MAERDPTVSIVVPVLDGASTVGACLTSILRADYPADRREVIVVDNGSSDDTLRVVRKFPVRLAHEARRGPAAARNRGITLATGEIVAFTDADCVVSVQWLRELVRGFESGASTGVAGEILPFPPSTAAERHAARIRHLSPERYLRRHAFPFAVSANLSFRRAVFDQVGGFDVDSPRGGESTDFCTRFSRATGMRLHFARAAVVFHRHRQTAWALFRQHQGYGRGHAYLYIKYGAEMPWGWRQTRTTYGDLFSSLFRLGSASLAYGLRRADRDELHFRFFEVVRKAGIRLGFMQEALARGHFYF
jgi:glycosyltransferase involved in cell wall biosynthesis